MRERRNVPPARAGRAPPADGGAGTSAPTWPALVLALVGVLDYRQLLAAVAVARTVAAVPLLRRESAPAVLDAVPAPAGDP